MSLAEVGESDLSDDHELSWREQREAERRSRIEARRQQLEAMRKPSTPVTLAAPTMVPQSRFIRTRTPGPAAPVPDRTSCETPLRLRLDLVPEGDEPEVELIEAACEIRTGLFERVFGPYRCFYKVCPHCRAEEVYPVTWRGLFIEKQLHRNPLVQRMRCERCLETFLRPGWVLGGIPAPLRPRGLYD